MDRIASSTILEKDSLAYWRVRIFFAIVFSGVLIGIFTFVPVITLVIKQKLWGLFIFDAAIWLLGIFLLLARRPGYETRAAVSLFLVYLVGLVIILNVGILSGGPAWLFAFAVLVGVLLGTKAALVALGINAATLLIIAGLIQSGHFDQAWVLFPSTENMITAGANFMLLNTIAAMSVAALVRGLISAHQKERDLTGTMKQEHAQLVELKNELELEVVEHKKTEEALRDSERRYRLIADNVADIIWTMDMDAKFTYISPSVHSMKGFSVAEALQQPLEAVLPSDSIEKVKKQFAAKSARVASGDPNGYRPVYFEVEQYCKDGSVIQTGNMARFLPGPENMPASVLGVTRDITQRKQAEEALRKSEENLARSRKMESLGLLAGGVAHDLNNVLAGIVSYPELILLELPGDSKLIEPIKTIQESGNRAAAIVQDLLTVARGVAITREPLNVSDLVHDYLSSPEFNKLKQFHPNVKITTDLSTELLNIKGSPVHLRKVVMNLVSNAAEAVDDGGHIRISTRNRYIDRPLKAYAEISPGEYVVLAVADDGPGIPAEDLERIFEPFYTKKFMGRSGTGLGLAVVWNIVLDHKGCVDVQSNGAGTNFALYLPITRAPISTRETTIPLEKLSGGGESILVVDDVDTQREISCKMLQTLGYHAEAVSSGESALAYLEQQNVDLVVLDMIMDPGISGRETYARIKKMHPHQKAIIVSGFAETDEVRETQKLGAGQYIKKPITLETLGKAVKKELALT